MSFLSYIGKLEYRELSNVILSALKEYLPKLTSWEIDLSSEAFKLRLREAIIKEIEETETKEKGFCYNERQTARASLKFLNNWNEIFLKKMKEYFLSQDEKFENLAKRAIQTTLDYFGRELDFTEEKILTELIKARLKKRVELIQQAAQAGVY